MAFGHVPAAAFGDLHGVDQIGAVRSGTAERPGQPGAAQQVGIAVGQLAEVDHAHGPRIAGGDVRGKSAQAFGEGHVRPQGAVLLARHGWHIDGVDGHAAFEILHHLFGDAHAHDLLCFLGGTADVRRRQ